MGDEMFKSSLDLNDKTHISPTEQPFFTIGKDELLTAIIIGKDKNNNEYYIDFSNSELNYLIECVKQAKIEMGFQN
jgi:hypothetical protein